MHRDDDYDMSFTLGLLRHEVSTHIENLSEDRIREFSRLDTSLEEAGEQVKGILGRFIDRKVWGLHQFLVDSQDMDYDWLLVHGVIRDYRYEMSIASKGVSYSVVFLVNFDLIDGLEATKDYLYPMSPRAIFNCRSKAEKELRNKKK